MQTQANYSHDPWRILRHVGCLILLVAMAQLSIARTENTPMLTQGDIRASELMLPGGGQGADSARPDDNDRRLAPTPPMGWNSWNWFGKTQINEQIVREVIDAMVSSGLRDAGYKYVIVDGGWRDTVLDANGALRPNPERFPHGIKVLADYAHARGLKFGLHTVPGTMDCGGDPVGGFGHEEVQISQFVDWGVDFLKLDKCRKSGGWDEAVVKQTYQKWHDLLARCGRDIVLSISAYKFRDWNPGVGHMSRTTRDIGSRTNGGARFDTFEIRKRGSVMGNAEMNSHSADDAGPGYWNDPDMLVVGSQGLTVAEQKIHFALWCVMSSPLFLGNDPRHMGTDEKSILLNKTCIHIDQDPAGQGRRVWKDSDVEAWSKELTTGEVALLVINRNPVAMRQVAVSLKELGIKTGAKLTDVYTAKKLRATGGKLSCQLAPQSGLFLLAKP